MIITRTPIRVSFLGGGTDYPSWYLKNGGTVVGGSIDKYSYVSARFLPPYHAFSTRVVYNKIETVSSNADIQHRAIKATIEFMGMQADGLEISHVSDMPSRSGMGSSSAFIVGLLNALAGLRGRLLSMAELTNSAIEIEQGILRETVGSQDQAWAAYGGLATMSFEKSGNINVYPLPLASAAVQVLEDHLALYYTGTTRTASDIASGYIADLANNARHQWATLQLVERATKALLTENWVDLGVTMDKAWELKRQLAGVTNKELDLAYATGRLAGAWGGKLLGAGGGGCLLFVVPPEKVAAVTAAVQPLGLVHVPFCFDFAGSRIIFADREKH